MSTPSVKKNLALSTIYQILVLAVPFVTTPYVSRVLGAEGIGVYSFTSSIATYFAMLSALGIMSYGSREISRARDDRAKMSKLFWEIEAMAIVSTSICLFVWMVWILLSPEYNVIYLILTMTILGTATDISWFFTGLEQFKFIVVRNSIVKICGVILLFVFIRERSDLTLYIFLMTLIHLLGILSMWIYIPQLVDMIDWRTISLKNHFKETLVYFIPTIATSVYSVLNKVLLGFMGGDIRENGYFEQATKIIMIAQTLTFTALNSVLGARIAYLFVDNKIEEIRQRIDMSLNYILFVGVGICFGMIGIAQKFVPWFLGPDFDDTVLLLQLLSPIILIIGISNCLGSHYYTPAGFRKQSAKYIVVGAIVNLVLNILLIPLLGARGAVIGSLTAELVITILYLANCKGYMTVPQILNSGWKKFLSGVVMFVAVYSFSLNSFNNTIVVLLSIIIGTVVYFVGLLLLKDKFVLHFLSEGSLLIKKHLSYKV